MKTLGELERENADLRAQVRVLQETMQRMINTPSPVQIVPYPMPSPYQPAPQIIPYQPCNPYNPYMPWPGTITICGTTSVQS